MVLVSINRQADEDINDETLSLSLVKYCMTQMLHESSIAKKR